MHADVDPWNLSVLLRHVAARKHFGRSLARYTSFRIGGPADVLVQVETLESLRHLQTLARHHSIPLFILGGGSNVLIRDGGIRGMVVTLRGSFRHYSMTFCQGEKTQIQARVYAGVGCSLSRLAMSLANQGWSGLEFAYGIPGTLGGAMIMNAGTYLGDLSRVLIAAQMLLADGQVTEVPSRDLGLCYRGSSYPSGAIVLRANIALQQGDRDVMVAAMRAANVRRQQTQPLWQPNAGSIFKNPPGMAAAKLIDDLGLKGTRIGGAMVSSMHANFVVNVNQATSADVEALMELIQEQVLRAYGVVLELEIRVVGEVG
jgi:UDP-N-acetylmuramate dehydrogenase